MVVILVILTAMIAISVSMYKHNHSTKQTMYYENIGFTMADGKPDKSKKV